MNDANDKDRLFIARCSLVLFIAGLLVPFVILVIVALRETRLSRETEQTATILAFGFYATAQVLAVVLGFIGQRHLSGRIGMFGPIIVFVLAFAVSMWTYFQSWGPDQEIKAPPTPAPHVAEELPPGELPMQPPVQPEEQPGDDEQAP